MSIHSEDYEYLDLAEPCPVCRSNMVGGWRQEPTDFYSLCYFCYRHFLRYLQRQEPHPGWAVIREAFGERPFLELDIYIAEFMLWVIKKKPAWWLKRIEDGVETPSALFWGDVYHQNEYHWKKVEYWKRGTLIQQSQEHAFCQQIDETNDMLTYYVDECSPTVDALYDGFPYVYINGTKKRGVSYTASERRLLGFGHEADPGWVIYGPAN